MWTRCAAKSNISTGSYFFAWRISVRQQNEAVSPDFSNSSRSLEHDLSHSVS